jgi:uncharacterized protein (DUF2147 family)
LVLCGALFVCLLGVAPAANASSTVSPIGEWLTQDGDGVIQIYRCGGALCGRIIGMSEVVRPDGSKPVDREGRPQCGLTILRQTGRGDDGKWEGTITNPDDGSTWNCEFWVASDGLHLRGYVVIPLLGRTQVWHRYAGQVTADCRMA